LVFGNKSKDYVRKKVAAGVVATFFCLKIREICVICVLEKSWQSEKSCENRGSDKF
jgi:hypothetical protein